ncbi:MAG: hypothetical protein CBC48_08500 [bacterium TMED88]|nr:hypothetical protein [Deltaproteobacteria bacterium]OUV32250.1 MAG: hypothetical protein CBC48_08500 [bacterium TMED88]
MAATIQEVTGLEAVLVKGDAGVFDVHVDDQLIFSKHQQGRYPEPSEILDHLPQTS